MAPRLRRDALNATVESASPSTKTTTLEDLIQEKQPFWFIPTCVRNRPRSIKQNYAAPRRGLSLLADSQSFLAITLPAGLVDTVCPVGCPVKCVCTSIAASSPSSSSIVSSNSPPAKLPLKPFPVCRLSFSPHDIGEIFGYISTSFTFLNMFLELSFGECETPLEHCCHS